MTTAQLTAIRDLAEKNATYNENTKTLIIKKGRMSGTYKNIEKMSAIEIVKCN